MKQSELSAFESSEKIECPNGCGKYKNLSVHWGHVHGDQPFPKGVKKVADTTRQKMAGDSHPLHGRSRSGKVCQKISESVTQAYSENPDQFTPPPIACGEDHPMHGSTRSESTRQRISKALIGSVVPEDRRRKISETLTGISRSEEEILKSLKARTKSTGIGVVPTKHTVRNGWERDVDLMLHDAGLDFEYEPCAFDIGAGHKYIPDFGVGEDIIEVKGHVWEGDIQRAARFMREHPEYRYIVIGNGDLPCDAHFSWDDRKDVMEIL